MSKRFLLTIITLLIIAIGAGAAVFLAKGYRLSPENQIITGTGILSLTSAPDQASVYLDGHLTSATNTNINSLIPKEYEVRIVKEGFIPWQKRIKVQEGLVTEVKATLFRAIPSVYPLTYSGAQTVLLSPDGQKIVYFVPEQKEGNSFERKKGGVWVWEMSEKPINFNRGGEPHQIAQSLGGYDYSGAQFRWSPDSSQVLVKLPNSQYLLLDTNRLNDPPRDITPIITATLKSWDEEQKAKDLTKLELIKDLSFRKVASDSAFLKWSPDETKLIQSEDGNSKFKIYSIEDGKMFELPGLDPEKGIKINYDWLPNSQHLVIVESRIGDQNKAKKDQTTFPEGKISIIEYDGSNKADIYVGNFDPNAVVAWPDSSRLVIVSSFPTPTASQPNLFGINLK